MENKSKTIIVLWDFTEKSEIAYAHAINFSKLTNLDITLLHVVKSDKDIDKVYQRLVQVADNLASNSKISTHVQVLKGSIFKTISNYVSQGHVELVIMGTHGIKGLQRFTGSWALKVIRGSRIPFLVVQDFPTTEKYNNIVFPVDFKKENIDKVKWGHYMATLNKAKIHIIHPRVSDKTFKKRIYSNMIFTKKYFDNTDVPYTIETVGKDIVNETIEYAKKVNANLILITISQTLTFADYLMGPSEQFIIANKAKLPVLVVSPKPKQLSGGFSATGT